MPKILIIDDEIAILESLEMFLGEGGYDIRTAATAEEGKAVFGGFFPEVVILDIRLPDSSGLDVLLWFNGLPQPPKVIMITAFHDMETAITSMKNGAFDYIHKPLDADEVETAVEKAVRAIEAERELPASREYADAVEEDIIIGKSKAITDVFKTIGMLCRNDATALIQGETGTGKELIARVIHKNSRNGKAPFITLDCSAVVENLLESELFGHEKGAFTGANQSKPGQIELAGKGTLFLDEIGELPLGIQGKLLGFLERREYLRVGGQYPLRSYCRILAATHRDLGKLVQQGGFRRDLYFRLNVVTLEVPPLSSRLGDIPELARHFLRIISSSMNKPFHLQDGIIPLLMGHHWAGNVRELKNVITAAAVLSPSNVILKEDIQTALSVHGGGSKSVDPASNLAEMEQRHILGILKAVGWNRTQAARLLGISLPTLRSKIRKFGIDSSES